MILLKLIILSALTYSNDFQKKIDSCNDCHGKDGASTLSEVPTISGMSQKYLSFTLASYRNKERICRDMIAPKSKTKTNMCKIVTSLSDQDIEKLVSFYASKPFKRASQAFDNKLIETGKLIHRAHCERCHSEYGSIAADEAGILSGQQRNYLVSSFQELSEGKRSGNSRMIEKFKELSKENLEALSHFYSSFK